MESIERVSLIIALACLVLAIGSTIITSIIYRNRKEIIRKPNPGILIVRRQSKDLPGTVIAVIGLLLLTISIVSRSIITGHGPFSNMYEFATAFSWGIIVMGLVFQWRYHTNSVKNVAVLIALLLLVFASQLPSRSISLVPALQQSTLLSVHVAAAVVAYGALTIGFASSILFLVQNKRHSSWLPETGLLDKMSYNSVGIGFPFLTLTIILGALWADIAWGRYWGWDPKETASLVTWLVYASFLHARVMRGWQGSKSALFLIIGFAAILMTFFGNYIFSGLHSYG